MADLLQVDPGSAARAMRVLREHGLVMLEREKGPAGRFGLSVYVLGKVAGLTVLGPGAVEPRPADPWLEEPEGVKPHTAAAGAEKPSADGPYGATPTTALPHRATEPASQESGLRPQAMASAQADRPRKSAPLALPAMQIPGQGTLDLPGGRAMTGVRVASPEGWQVSVAWWGVVGGASWGRVVWCWAGLVVGSRVAESTWVDGRCVDGLWWGWSGKGFWGWPVWVVAALVVVWAAVRRVAVAGGVVSERVGNGVGGGGLVVGVDVDGVGEGLRAGAVMVAGDGGGGC